MQQHWRFTWSIHHVSALSSFDSPHSYSSFHVIRFRKIVMKTLLCSSHLSWYREGSSVPLQAPISKGGSKDRQTTSTLSVTPKREDDGAKYRCVVWNRAMPEGQRLETTVTLNVNCEYHIHFTVYSMFEGIKLPSHNAHPHTQISRRWHFPLEHWTNRNRFEQRIQLKCRRAKLPKSIRIWAGGREWEPPWHGEQMVFCARHFVECNFTYASAQAEQRPLNESNIVMKVQHFAKSNAKCTHRRARHEMGEKTCSGDEGGVFGGRAVAHAIGLRNPMQNILNTVFDFN